MKNKIILTWFCIAAILATALPCMAEEKEKEDAAQLETVTVTARKVAVDKQELSANISAFTGEILEDLALTNLADVITITPNINFNKMDSHSIQYTFRGIGGTANMNKVYYVNLDDVAVPYVATDTLLDVERIEMLRGGQGAFYGRNTHTGMLNVITRDPDFSAPQAQASISYEKFNRSRFQAVVGGAAGEKTAFRLAMAYNRTDGYFENTQDRNDANHSDQFTGRAKFLFQPDDTNKFTFGLYGDKFDAAFDSYGPVGAPVTLETQNDEPGQNKGDIISPTLKWEKVLGSGITLTSISNYSHSTYGFVHDWDFSPADMVVGLFDETFNVFSQELRISGGEKRSLQWLAGIFGRCEHLDTQSTMEMGTAAGPMAGLYDRQDSSVETNNLAGFGQMIYRVHPRIELSGALRLDYEQKNLEWKNSSTTGTPIVNYNDDEDWLALSPSASAAWLISDRQRVYAMVSRGFKAGDYNNVMPVPLVATSGSVDPEYTMTYELGYKGRYLNNRLEFNAAAFYIDWTDMQVDLQIPGTGFYKKLNAADAHSSGMELEARLRPARGWDFFAGLGYMFEYEFDKFNDGTQDFAGNKLPYTNEYTVNLGLTRHFDSGFFLGADTALRGPYTLIENNRDNQDEYWLVNANTGYMADHWEISFYGRNLLDERYAVTSFNGALMAGEPFTCGATVKIRF